MNAQNWTTTKRTGIPCAGCGKIGTCTVAPDGTAFKCWKNGGAVIQTAGANGRAGAHTNGTGYVGKATRKAAGKPAGGAEKSPRGNAHPTREDAAESVLNAVRRVHADAALTVHFYTDAFAVARLDFGGGKECRPLRRDPDGWRIGDPTGPLPIYNRVALDVDPAAIVFVVEGEKCADAAGRIGLPAVTGAHGSSQAKRSDWSPLAGRDVVILPDLDAPGEKHADEVARLLVGLNPPAAVKIVKLPHHGGGDAPEGYDLADWIDGLDSRDAGQLRAEVSRLADAAPTLDRADLIGGLKLTSFDKIKLQSPPWLWPGRIVAGAITVLGSDPGLGKGNVVCDLAARITRGRAWPDDAPTCGSGDVILANAEDDPASVMGPRLRAAGADLRRVHLVDCVSRRDEQGNVAERAFTLEHVAELDDRLRSIPNAKLVVIDPLGSYMGGADSYKDSDVRGLFAPLVELARKYRIAVLVVMHRRKTFSRSADESLLGSGTRGLARITWHVYADHEDEDHARRYLVQGKNNVGKRMTGLAFEIVGDKVEADDGEVINTCRVEWSGETVELTADDLHLAEQSRVGRSGKEDEDAAPTKEQQAADYIADCLGGGPASWKTIQRGGRQAGHAAATLERARGKVAESFKAAGAADGKWFWRLIGDERTDPVDAAEVPEAGAEVATLPPDDAEVAELPFSDPKMGLDGAGEGAPTTGTGTATPDSTPETELRQLRQLRHPGDEGVGKTDPPPKKPRPKKSRKPANPSADAPAVAAVAKVVEI